VANVNDAPVLAQDLADQTTTQGETLQFALPPNTFTDADTGDTLSLVATLANGEALPQWMRFDAASQRFVISPPLGGDDGPIAVRVVATDASGASAQVVFAVVVLPAPVGPVVPDPAPAPAEAPVLEPAPAPEPEPEPEPAPAPEPAAPQAPETLTPTDEFVVGGGAARLVSRAAPGSAAPDTRIPPSNAVQVAEVPKYSNLAGERAAELLKRADVLRTLDELQRQMAELTAGQRTVVASSVVITAGLSAGYVVWLVRGGVLLSSMLSALPAWQVIDPMPVMTAANGAARRRDPEPSDEPEVERLFGDHPQATPHESASTAARPAATAAATAVPDTTADAARSDTPSTQAHP
jgi:hypothetical protein